MGNKNTTRYVSWRGRVWKRFIPPSPLQQFVSADVRSYGYSRTGGNNPAYKRIVKSGLNAANPMNVSVSTAEAGDFRTVVYVLEPVSKAVWTYGNEGVFINVNEPLGLASHSGSSSMVNASALALRVLNRKTTARRRQVMGAVVIGEIGKTVAMIAKPAKALRSKVATFANRLRKLRKRLPRSESTIKVIADTWLEAQFGWKPLLADVRDGATAVARTVEKDVLERQQFRAYGDDVGLVLTSDGTVGPVGWDSTSGVVYRVNRSVTNKSECILYGRWSTRIQDSSKVGLNLRRLRQLSGLNWEDEPAQAWELIPWSFLIDYFINVGDVLEGVGNFRNGIDWVEQVQIVTTEDRRTYSVSVDALKASLGANYLTHDGLQTQTIQSYRTISRQAFLGPLTPSLAFSLPQNLQWLNIAALVAGGRSFQPFTHR